MCDTRQRICKFCLESRDMSLSAVSCQTYLLGLSRRPPRLVVSWQQDRMYRISPFRLNRLSEEASVAAAAKSAAANSPRGPLRLASIKGQHPPTQWL